jgi:TatD DNase family protein
MQVLWSWDWSTLGSHEIPPLDCHAHIAPDVTDVQLDALDGAIVFAVTRSLAESEEVVERRDNSLVWGCGVHPGVASARREYDEQRFRDVLQHFSFVGEVGLDRRAGAIDEQCRIFQSVLSAIAGMPVIVSVHSSGCVENVLDLIGHATHPGIVLHWFLGDTDSVRRATEIGCYFSVNSAMSDDALRAIPHDRLLPETDFPANTRRGATRPGDVFALESRLAVVLGETSEQVRWRFYRNLRTLAVDSGAIERFPEAVADRLLGT